MAWTAVLCASAPWEVADVIPAEPMAEKHHCQQALKRKEALDAYQT